MTTVTLWLLLAIGTHSGSGNAAPTVVLVERFVTLQECERLRAVLAVDGSPRGARGLRCVEAAVAKP